MLYKLVNNYNQLKFVIATTSLCVVASLLILVIGYNLMGVEIRSIEILFSITAPLFIVSMVTWFLYGLIKKLDYTERQLRYQMIQDKQEEYLATINGAQHVINNLMNGFILINLEIDKHLLFNQQILKLFLKLQDDSIKLMKELSSVSRIEPKVIRRYVAPRIDS